MSLGPGHGVPGSPGEKLDLISSKIKPKLFTHSSFR